MNFKQFYEFPLKLDIFGEVVFTNDDERAFDFFDNNDDGQTYLLSEDLQNALVACLNSEDIHFLIENASYIYKDSTIFIVINKTPFQKPLHFINIRGWGHLTGTGGLGFSDKKATKIQDEFAQFIIDKLSIIQ